MFYTQFYKIVESKLLFITRICFVSELGIQIANKIGSIFILQRLEPPCLTSLFFWHHQHSHYLQQQFQKQFKCYETRQLIKKESQQKIKMVLPQ